LLGARGVAWAILRAALARIPAARVIGQSDTFADAMTRIPDEQPDVVISAPALANRSALPVLRALHAACPATTLVVYAATLDAGTLHAYARAGVTGYLGWQLDHTTFQHSLAALLAGPVVVGSFALTELLVGVPSLPAAPPLSERERLVLNRLAEGLTRAQIARAERLSLRTVERTTADLMTKLAAPSPVALGVKAAQLGLVPPLQDEAAPAEGAESDGGGDQAMAERRQAGYCSRGSRSGGVPLHHSA
jgi:DNA-binding NarL/FixJ family response regulator